MPINSAAIAQIKALLSSSTCGLYPRYAKYGDRKERNSSKTTIISVNQRHPLTGSLEDSTLPRNLGNSWQP